MSISTHSQFVPVPSGVSIALPSEESDRTKKALTSYYGICAKYAEWTDPLTTLVKGVGARLFGSRSIGSGTSTASVAIVEKFAQQLIQELLVDDLYRQPLLKPKLDRIWVWEERDLKHYKSLFGHVVSRSPFDLLPIVDRTHDFATEMLDWAKVYSKPTITLPSPSTSTTLLSPSMSVLWRNESDGRLSNPTREPSLDPSMKGLLVISYRNLAKTSLETQAAIQVRRGVEMETKLLAAIRHEATSSRRTFEEDAKNKDAFHLHEMEKGLEAIESSYKAGQDELRKKVEHREADLKFTKAEIESGEIRFAQQQTTIQVLAQRNAQLHV